MALSTYLSSDLSTYLSTFKKLNETPLKSGARSFAIWLILVVLALKVNAAPMGFKDSQMLMLDYERTVRSIALNHAFTARDAFGFEVMSMRMPGVQIETAGGVSTHVHAGSGFENAVTVTEKTLRREYAELNYTRLLGRWNGERSQANIWFVGGIGGVRGSEFSGTRAAVTPGLQLDYETTRVYAMVASRLFRAGSIKHDKNAARLGFSFYEAEYDETQPWFVIEVRKIRGMTARPEITPMLRLINKRLFVDIGVDVSKQPIREYNGAKLNRTPREIKLQVMVTF